MIRTQNLAYATDEECTELRRSLVRAGKIVPAKEQVPAVSREEDVKPSPPRKYRNAADIPDEGMYCVKSIKSDAEYGRRKHNYLLMLQSILRVRRELRLEFENGVGDGNE